MKAKMKAEILLLVSMAAAAVLSLAKPHKTGDDPRLDDAPATNTAVAVDLDFTRMNPTMQMAYVYRLAANPKEFEGKALRISGTYLTRVDESDGKRYFGCLLSGAPGSCSCCSMGCVLEFEPSDPDDWTTNCPPVQSSIVVSGLLRMVKSSDNVQRQPVATIPRIVRADVRWKRKAVSTTPFPPPRN